MPFKSKAQYELFKKKVKTGEISQAKFNEWSRDTDFSKLPERAIQKSTKVGKVKSVKVIK